MPRKPSTEKQRHRRTSTWFEWVWPTPGCSPDERPGVRQIRPLSIFVEREEAADDLPDGRCPESPHQTACCGERQSTAARALVARADIHYVRRSRSMSVGC